VRQIIVAVRAVVICLKGTVMVRVGGEQCEVTANNALGMSRVVVERDAGCFEAALHSASRLVGSARRASR
jgi:hypothetical protein